MRGLAARKFRASCACLTSWQLFPHLFVPPPSVPPPTPPSCLPLFSPFYHGRRESRYFYFHGCEVASAFRNDLRGLTYITLSVLDKQLRSAMNCFPRDIQQRLSRVNWKFGSVFASEIYLKCRDENNSVHGNECLNDDR